MLDLRGHTGEELHDREHLDPVPDEIWDEAPRHYDDSNRQPTRQRKVMKR